MDDFATGYAVGQDSNNDGGFGGSGSWVWILVIFALLAWGGNGFGGGFGGGGTGSEVQRSFDTSTIIGKLDGISNGICSLGYDQLSQMNGINANIASGFNRMDNAVCTLGYQNAQLINGVDNTVNQGFNATQLAMMQGFNGVQAGQTALGTQFQQCCCDNKAMLADMRYQMATDTCAVTTNASNNTRDLLDNQNAGTRAILDAIASMKTDAMQDKIAELTAQKQALELAASQAAQNNYLIGALRPAPVPAYTVPAPFGCGCSTQTCC